MHKTIKVYKIIKLKSVKNKDTGYTIKIYPVFLLMQNEIFIEQKYIA